MTLYVGMIMEHRLYDDEVPSPPSLSTLTADQ